MRSKKRRERLMTDIVEIFLFSDTVALFWGVMCLQMTSKVDRRCGQEEQTNSDYANWCLVKRLENTVENDCNICTNDCWIFTKSGRRSCVSKWCYVRIRQKKCPRQLLQWYNLVLITMTITLSRTHRKKRKWLDLPECANTHRDHPPTSNLCLGCITN